MANLYLVPDIVFLDYDMKPYDGLFMLDKVKGISTDVHVILISGQKEVSIAVQALRNGAFEYIIKGDKELDMITNAVHKIFSISKLIV